MSESELQCQTCRKPATRLLVSNELGGSDDRMYICANPSCRPSGEWQDYPMDGAGLAKEYTEKNP